VDQTKKAYHILKGREARLRSSRQNRRVEISRVRLAAEEHKGLFATTGFVEHCLSNVSRPDIAPVNNPFGTRLSPMSQERSATYVSGPDTIEIWSGRRDSNPRPRPWQGRALPLSYTRIPKDCRRSIASGRAMPNADIECNSLREIHQIAQNEPYWTKIGRIDA
jgi:hypothetical protein